MFSLIELLEGDATRLLYDDATIGCKNLRTLSRKGFGKAQRKALESANENVIDALEQVFTQEIMQAFSSLATSVSSMVPAGIGITEGIAATIARTAVAGATPDFDRAFRDMHQYAQDRALTITMATTTTDPESFRRTDLVQSMERAHQQRLASLLPTLTEQTRRAIVEAVRDNIESNRNPLQAKKTIRDAVQGASLYPGVAAEKGEAAALSHRASVIARTEVAWARNHANVTYLQQSDDVEGLYVVDGPDCGWHDHDDPDKANGKHVTFDEARDYPISHPNCRRSFGPLFRPFEPDTSGVVIEEPPVTGEGQVPSGRLIEATNKGYEPTDDLKGVAGSSMKVIEGVLPGLRIPENTNGVRYGTIASDESGINGKFGRSENPDNPFDFISVDPALEPKQMAITFYHEYGHYVDARLLARADGEDISHASSGRGTRAMSNVQFAMYDTPETLKLLNLTHDEGAKDWAVYASSNREQFARAFSQYMAEVQGGELAKYVRSMGMPQWSEQSFRPIKKALDDLFREQGWME